MRTMIDTPPFMRYSEKKSWHLEGLWPCKWIKGIGLGTPPFAAAYRKCFKIDSKKTIRVHVSADERYELYLDGRLIGRGSEYGTVDNWYFESYDITLDKGEHVIVAKVWSLGNLAPHSQTSLEHGFIFAPESFTEEIGTGCSRWEYKKLDGIEFEELKAGYLTPFWGTGANIVIDAEKYPWGFEKGLGDDWLEVRSLHEGTNGYLRNGAAPSHLMRPAQLPEMISSTVSTAVVRYVSQTALKDAPTAAVAESENIVREIIDWDLIGKDKSVTVAPNTARRVIYDLQDYYCAYPSITVSGGKGSRISLQWAESLFNETQAKTKGNRDIIEGKYFLGVGDVFLPDGGKKRAFNTLWWQSGRYVQLHVQTADAPLTIEKLKLCETRYPFEMESFFSCDDERLSSVIPIALRGLQMCAHEVYYDCPYYEQLMYSGDTRLHILSTFAVNQDGRLPRKAIEMFDISRLHSGLTRSLYPSRYMQLITPFSLAWVGMVYDYAAWRGDKQFIKQRMSGVRNVLDAVLNFLNKDGLIEKPAGWNFIDWVPQWKDGVPPGADSEASGIINLYLVYILNLVCRLEEWMGEAELKARWIRIADQIMLKTIEKFWDAKRGMFADDLARRSYSEHAQCLAVLGGRLDDDKLHKISSSLRNEKNIARTTISFTHYLFETYRELNMIDLFFERMKLWFELKEKGLKTTPEWPEPTRSDCHGWGAHPIYHYFATVLGIRPSAMGFNEVDIAPQLGHLKHVCGELVHPSGIINVEFEIRNKRLYGTVRLPYNINGMLRYNGNSVPLYGGVEQIIEC